jgi:hypothetical protein
MFCEPFGDVREEGTDDERRDTYVAQQLGAERSRLCMSASFSTLEPLLARALLPSADESLNDRQRTSSGKFTYSAYARWRRRAVLDIFRAAEKKPVV